MTKNQKEEIKNNFLIELSSLMAKYGAAIGFDDSLEDEYSGGGMYISLFHCDLIAFPRVSEIDRSYLIQKIN